MALHHSIPFAFNSNDSIFGIGTIANHSVLLIKPLAFMNRSGPAVRQLAEHYNVSREKTIIIHDDLDLAFGRLKIKEKGGSGGHRGIGSLIDAFEDGNFIRIRIGIGRPDNDEAIVDYVLDQFSGSESAQLNQIIIRAREATKTILCQGIREAMNSFNDRRLNTSS